MEASKKSETLKKKLIRSLEKTEYENKNGSFSDSVFGR